jgi:hypothetical protein
MDAFRCRSSYRRYDWEEVGTSRTGFRIVTELAQVPGVKMLSSMASLSKRQNDFGASFL